MHYAWIRILFFLFPFLPLNTAQLELFPIDGEKVKARILHLNGRHTLYFFEDQTIAYVRHPPYESRTWSEWWNDIEHFQPDQAFYFRLEDWNLSSSFQIYSYQWKEHPIPHSLENLFKEDNRLASQYLYFIENKETGEMTLCQIWSLTELGSFIAKYGEERYHEGFTDGNRGCQ